MIPAITPAILATPALLGAALMLVLLAYSDLSSRRLPNTWVGMYAALFVLHAWASGMGWQQLGGHAIVAAAAMALLVLLFILRAMGGGDVKLWTVLMLWAGPAGAIMAVFIVTISGALLGSVGWLIQRLLRVRPHWKAIKAFRMLTAARGVPYGVGLTLAGLHNLLTISV